ncbi:peptide-methionine (S)-S-oxide reductase MsrA [Algiphilus sp. W345]|uniref:Peptide methionine sulfoxide reductase MsrA n=1 Tax=Banduia mediterranea TaxID=3075609 RepID=A0ABU2WEZ2_9GAMM|nr:peptide-methionine (S)-S-oxide reductase MsrA [Algiphilus sp. W345]MDT0496090.1 peptide-methionine (S)-S-oxide reductase MsrA [Algiphilus sp. W345]
MALFGSSLKIKPSEFPVAEFDPTPETSAPQLAILAGGCFWCVEAVYQELDGVNKVVNGYSGGSAETADYTAVCTGTTEHAEVVQIEYDPAKTSFGELLRIFFSIAHDPTQLDRQGNDLGTQYRSAIFYQNDLQKAVAERYIAQLDAAGVFSCPIVTRLEPLQDFFEAEAYHQNYASQHPRQPYIAGVALPKLAKLREYFGDRLKP